MKLVTNKKLGLGAAKLMDDLNIKKSIGVFSDVLVKVDSFIFPTNFVNIYYKLDFNIPIILGRLFLAMGSTLVVK